MGGDNWAASREIEVLERTVRRLEERFGIEQQQTVDRGDIEALLRLRDRARTFFSVEIEKMGRELARISAGIESELEHADEAREQARELGLLISRLRARFVGVPHRLLRNAETVARLNREQSVEEPKRDSGDDSGQSASDDGDLFPTDPPIECPICGETLLRDGDFTLLVCPGCGSREEL